MPKHMEEIENIHVYIALQDKIPFAEGFLEGTRNNRNINIREDTNG